MASKQYVVWENWWFAQTPPMQDQLDLHKTGLTGSTVPNQNRSPALRLCVPGLLFFPLLFGRSFRRST